MLFVSFSGILIRRPLKDRFNFCLNYFFTTFLINFLINKSYHILQFISHCQHFLLQLMTFHLNIITHFFPCLFPFDLLDLIFAILLLNFANFTLAQYLIVNNMQQIFQHIVICSQFLTIIQLTVLATPTKSILIL